MQEPPLLLLLLPLLLHSPCSMLVALSSRSSRRDSRRP